ncbi:AT-rich interactive domain-containing protein 4A [Salarias fasciatus]|uniref:AT-rich interactive domain-containing protein 4A n=1 Tax=Salarias fasciatus TaxID=181472 RepID=UPI001176C8A4|nr:AT-rich interactive domain-containing protein 4A [Salarias fasciatus]XP_029972394.1 AT-rich interactive domain-containing protein 4A [Salarias fasciatus]
MKAADEPAYLTVGTDVSAKYRGAFCEAKIKTVKRMVKVKVTLKGESTSQVVQDDQVKGTLRVGSTVEVKTNEGLCCEAVISKLTDASLYTVVFDDGDEKTLRRTSLCLKGERHFAESETLDQLPLTNPEHFGTPVIKKSNRGGRRSSQAVAEEENESSSSEDEDEDRRRLNDELLGKVCSIQSGDDCSCWFLALVVSPSCNDEQVVRKDQCLLRSFSDGKFSTVVRRHIHVVNSVSITRSEFSNRRGFEAAQDFLRSREVPDVWKMDMSQILDSSSSEEDDDQDEKEKESEDEEEEEDDDEEEKKKKKKRIKEEPEEELDPEERDHFLQQLYKFMEDRGTPINKPPVLGYKDLNLFKLFRLVYQQGGCRKIESGTIWKQIYMDLGIPILNSAASYNVKTAYKKYLYGFEEYCRSASITFRTIHHNNPRPPAAPASQRAAGPELREAASLPVKTEPVEVKGEEAESDSESEKEEVKERHSSGRGRRRCVGGRMKMERRGGAGENSEEQQREGRRRSNRRTDDSERGSEDEEDDDDDDDDEEEEEEEDEEESQRRREERAEDDEDGDSVTGTKVRVKYGRGKTQKIYEAHIKKTDMDNGEQFYLVHYYGWNVRYDEWVKADRIIWPGKKATKERARKKLKNKEESEEEKPAPLPQLKPTAAKRGRPQIRATPANSANRSVSKTPGSEGRSNGGRRTDTPSNMANGDNAPGRRTRRTSGMYDSDRASNEDSGNSSDDSGSEDPPDKKSSLWSGRGEAPPSQAEEEEPEEEEEEPEDEEDARSEVANVPVHGDTSSVSMAMMAQLPAAAVVPCPSMPQEKADKVVSQSEEHAEQGAEPAGDAAVLPTHLDNKTSPAGKTAPVHDSEKTSPGREAFLDTRPSRTPPPPPLLPDSLTKTPERPSPAPEDEERSTAVSSPRIKGRRAIVRETGCETPPRIPLVTPAASSPAHTAPLPSPPRSGLKRQDEPMVVLHCLPTQRLPPESPAASDTDSASEEEDGEEEAEQERSVTAVKRKAAEQRGPGKKLRPSRRPEEAASPKTLASPLRRSEGATKVEEWPRPEQEEVAQECLMAMKEQEAQIPPPTSTEPPTEEAEPQMGAEALVCHEVDLDDPDEKEKPTPAPEHLLLLMREQPPAPPPLPHLLHSTTASPHLPQALVRPFFSSTTLSPAPYPEELRPSKEEEGRGAMRAEPEGDSSPGGDGSASSSSTSLLSLQDKERGHKRVTDSTCSPTAKKQKRSQKRPSTPGKAEKNGAGHSSDSEDQSRLSSLKPQKSPRCPALSSPSHSKEKSGFMSPQRTYKWTFQLDELDNMSSSERISFLQDKLQEIRKYYLSLKSEVASIDRRRKRLKKKEREVSNTTASTSSGSSDTAMSPSSASPTQNNVAVECR